MPTEKLKSLEDRLNKDDALRDEFMKDPAAILKREGVELSDAHLKAVHDQISQMNLSGLTKMPAARPKIGISIFITIRF